MYPQTIKHTRMCLADYVPADTHARTHARARTRTRIMLPEQLCSVGELIC
jgi:hypothetical protein